MDRVIRGDFPDKHPIYIASALLGIPCVFTELFLPAHQRGVCMVWRHVVAGR